MLFQPYMFNAKKKKKGGGGAERGREGVGGGRFHYEGC